MPKEKKTNAARILDREGVTYRLVPYEVDPDNLAADHVAESLGEPVERVFKTLVLRGDRTGLFVCVIAGNREVDLKKAAKIAGAKKADLIPMKELLSLTGYIRGGCSPIGMKKPFPIFIHATATQFNEIFISAGIRGLQVGINPIDLIEYTHATVCDITTQPQNDTTDHE